MLRLLDTDVMIDIHRGYPPACEWFEGLEEAPGLPGFVVLELTIGCRNKAEVEKLQCMIAMMPVFWATPEACGKLLPYFASVYLAHGTGIADAMIGICSVEAGATLCTFNDKHFQGIPGIQTERPYAKG